MGGWHVGVWYKNLFWTWLLIGLALSASASAHEKRGGGRRPYFRIPANLHKTEYRLVFPNFPPADYSEKDSAKLSLTFEKQFDLKGLVLAWNGRTLFGNKVLAGHAVWVDGQPVLEIDLDALFLAEKRSFFRHVKECAKQNGRFEIWWNAPVRLVKGELSWSRGGDTQVLPVPPRVVLDQVAPAELINGGSEVAVAFHAMPEADTFECAVDQNKKFSPCQSPFFVKGLKRGMHSFSLRAKRGETVGGVTSFSMAFLGNSPKISLKKVEPAGYLVGGDTVTLAFADSVVSKKAREILCQIDNNQPAVCRSPFVAKGLAEGGHIVTIRAAKPDLFEAPVVYAFRVEMSRPVLTVTDRPAELSALTDAAFAFAADRSATFRCALDGAAPVACVSPWALSQLGEGIHDAVLVAVDEAGRESDPYAFQWRIDLTAPQFTFAPEPSRPVLSVGALSVSYSATEPLYHVSCDLNGVAMAGCDSPLRFSGLSDGSYRVRVTGQDSVGNVGQFSYDFSVDSQSPLVEVRRVEPSSSPTADAAATFEFGANEASVFTCALDAAEAVPCVSPVSYTDLSEGAHTVTIYAQDGAGNVSQAVASWVLDRSAPVVTLLEAIPADAVTASQSLSLSVLVTETADLFYQLDSGAELAFTSPLVVNDLIEGHHRLQVRARDLAGNVSVPLVYEWTVAMPALVSITEVANPGEVILAQSNAFSFSGSHAVEYRCRLDAGPVAPCVSPFAVANLADGDHVFSVRGVNIAGEEGVPATYAWRIEAPPAVVVVSGSVTDGAVVSDPSAQFSFSSNGDNFRCSLDGAAYAACTSPFSASNLSDGAHSFRVFAHNARGVAGVAAQVGWTVQTPAAIVTLGTAVPSQAVTRSATLSVSFTSTSQNNFCALDAGASVPCASPVAYDGLGNGPHSVRVYGVSVGGTVGASQVYSWNVDQVAPIVTIDSTNPATSPTAQVFMTITFHADETASFLCALDGAAPQACASPWTVTVSRDGQHAVAIWAVDAAGNQSVVPATHTWSVDRTFNCSNFAVTQVSRSSVMVSWQTTSPSTSVVRYGFGSNRNQTATGSSNVTQHSVLVSNLLTNTFYSALGQSTTPDGRSCQTSAIFFTTPP